MLSMARKKDYFGGAVIPVNWYVLESEWELPSTIFESLPSERRLTPEEMLLAAMLSRAVRDLAVAHYDAKRIRRQAREWLTSNRQDLFSFLQVCESLQLTTDAINRIRALAELPPKNLRKFLKNFTFDA